MRILQISKYYYPFIGGTEQVARDISNSLKDEHDVRVFSFNHERNNICTEVDGVPVVKAGSFIKISSQSLSLSYGRLLKKEFYNFAPEVVIFHYPNPFAAKYLLKLLRKFPKCKLIVYWHLDIVKQKFLKLFFNKQNIKLLERAEKVIAATPYHIKYSEFLASYQEKCQVISYASNIINNETVRQKAALIRAENVGKIILFACGRHVPYKGIEYLIRASRFLNDDYVIYISGKGPLTKSLKKLAEGDKKVNFIGKISNEEKEAYYSACDVFCFPSITKNEAFGLALAEAMRYGKPSVTFTIQGSGVNYVSLNGVTGIEVENKNVIQYAKAIKRLGTDKELAEKYGAAAKERAENNFTYDKFKENFINFIEGLKK